MSDDIDRIIEEALLKNPRGRTAEESCRAFDFRSHAPELVRSVAKAAWEEGKSTLHIKVDPESAGSARKKIRRDLARELLEKDDLNVGIGAMDHERVVDFRGWLLPIAEGDE